MRKWNMSDIQRNMESNAPSVHHKVHLFRKKTEEQGWNMKRTRPRHSDEKKALNYISRKALRIALEEGSIRYDKERRVLIIAKYSRG